MFSKFFNAVIDFFKGLFAENETKKSSRYGFHELLPVLYTGRTLNIQEESPSEAFKPILQFQAVIDRQNGNNKPSAVQARVAPHQKPLNNDSSHKKISASTSISSTGKFSNGKSLDKKLDHKKSFKKDSSAKKSPKAEENVSGKKRPDIKLLDQKKASKNAGTLGIEKLIGKFSKHGPYRNVTSTKIPAKCVSDKKTSVINASTSSCKT